MPFIPQKEFTLDRIFRLATWVALAVGFIYTLSYLSSALIPFFIAVLLAYMIEPFVSFIQHKLRVKNRIASVFLTFILLFLVLTGIVVILVPAIVGEIAHMYELLSSYVNNSAIRQRTIEFLPPDLELFAKEFMAREDVRGMFNAENIGQAMNILGSKVLPGVWGVFSGSINAILGVLGLAVILMYLVFILIDYERIMEGWPKIIPPQWRNTLNLIIGDVSEAMNNYFRAQALVAFITGIIFAIGFSIISLPLGIGLGLSIGLLNMVPYLQTLGLVPAVLFALVHSLESGTSFWVMLGLVLLIFVVAQLIQDGFLVPKIMGNVTGMNPAVILLVLSVWGKLLGMLGLIIALPATMVLWSYYQRFLKNTVTETDQIES